MDIFYVYIYLDPRKPGKYCYGDYSFDFEPFYVGKGSGNRIYQISSRTAQFRNKVRKIKSDGYIIPRFVLSDLKEEKAFDLEALLIFIIGRSDKGKGPLLNYTDGGEGVSGRKLTEEHKKRIGDANRGKKQKPEDIRKRAKSLKGRKLSDAHRNRIAKGGKGRKHTEETKRRISQKNKGKRNGMYGITGEKHYMYGKTHTDEAKRKISISKIGKKPPNYGIPCSEEQKKKDLCYQKRNRKTKRRSG